MSKIRMFPPKGSVWRRGSSRVGDEGIEVESSEVAELRDLGWSSGKVEKQEPKKSKAAKADAKVNSDG